MTIYFYHHNFTFGESSLVIDKLHLQRKIHHKSVSFPGDSSPSALNDNREWVLIIMNCNTRLRELKTMFSWIAYGMNCAKAHYGGKSFFTTKYCFALGDFSTHFAWSKWRYSFITTTKFALADFISPSYGRFHPRSGFHPSRTDFIAKPCSALGDFSTRYAWSKWRGGTVISSVVLSFRA